MIKLISMDRQDRLFQYCIIGSLVIHLAALVQFSYTNRHYFKRPVNKIEVVYERPAPVVNKPAPPAHDIQSITGQKLPPPPRALLEENRSAISPLNELAAKSEKFSFDQTISPKINSLKSERKISVPPVKTEKISNPVYLNYYQTVRSRIQERAYQNYGRLDIGEVYLTFVLSSNGALKQLKLIEDKTSATAYLRNVGLRSIRDASPFPSFPGGLSYPELSFNVVISFEAKE